MKCNSTIMRRMDWGSFRCWCDVNRSTFHKDMRKSDFYVSFSFPVILTFWSQIFSPSYSCPGLYLHQFQSFYGSLISSKSKTRDRRTDGRTDGKTDRVQYFIRPSREGRLKILPVGCKFTKQGTDCGTVHRHCSDTYLLSKPQAQWSLLRLLIGAIGHIFWEQ